MQVHSPKPLRKETTVVHALLSRTSAPLRAGTICSPMRSSTKNASHRRKRARSAGLALTIQTVVVGALLVVPLLFTESIDLYKADKTVLLAPPPPATPPPPAMHVQSIPEASLLQQR
jgi:hypothetical protein